MTRPSGCNSYDLPFDKVGRKISRGEANILYNYGDPYLNNVERGKYMKNCVGIAPPETLDKRFVMVTGECTVGVLFTNIIYYIT